MNPDAATRSAADLATFGIEERDNREPLLPESRIVREGQPQIARAQSANAARFRSRA